MKYNGRKRNEREIAVTVYGQINTKRSKIKIKVVHEGLHICISQKGEIFYFQKGGYRCLWGCVLKGDD